MSQALLKATSSRPILTLGGLKPRPQPHPELIPELIPEPAPAIEPPKPAPPRVQLIEKDPVAAAAFGPLHPLPKRSRFRGRPQRLKFATYPEIGLTPAERRFSWAMRVARKFAALSPEGGRNAALRWATERPRRLFIESCFDERKTKAEVIEALTAMWAGETEQATESTGASATVTNRTA